MLKHFFPLSLTLVAACASTSYSAADKERAPGPELAEAIAGRIAEKPQSCVLLRDLEGNRSVDNGDAIVFGSKRDDLIYVNRPAGGCPSLQFGRSLVTKTTTGSLCRGDIADVVDLQAGFQQGSCGLGDFVPYRKTGK